MESREEGASSKQYDAHIEKGARHLPPDHDRWLASLKTWRATMALSAPCSAMTSCSLSLKASPSNGVSRRSSRGAGPYSPLHQRTPSPAALSIARVTPSADLK